jgi:hypothetical protein
MSYNEQNFTLISFDNNRIIVRLISKIFPSLGRFIELLREPPDPYIFPSHREQAAAFHAVHLQADKSL